MEARTLPAIRSRCAPGRVAALARRAPGARSVGALLAACALALAACSPSGPPSLLVVTFDTTRYDRIGADGDAEAQTPTVDALAARGVVFDHAYASTGLTLPSHTTIMTGLEPLQHGVACNGLFRVPPDVDTLAEVLGAAGYQTAAFVSAVVLSPDYHLDQGFGTYDARVDPRTDPLGMMVDQRNGGETTDAALGWLKEHASSRTPFFLWVHYYDPHQPRTVKPPFDRIPDPYRAEIAYADSQLKRLLEGVERSAGRRGVVVAFTGDHGEGLGEHGEVTHGILAYDATLHVPMILAGPGVPHGVRSGVLARHVDLMPTIAHLLHVKPPEGLPGRDLLAATAHPEPSDDEAKPEVVGWFQSRGPEATLGWAPIEGVRTLRWKYTATPAPAELYDVLDDPHERRNRATQDADVSQRMAALFRSFRESHARPDLESQRHDLSAEQMAQLAALGYVQAPKKFSAAERPDPRRFAPVWEFVDSARSAAAMRDYTRAIEMLEPLAESPSVGPLVLRTLAPIYQQADRMADAIRAWRRYLDLTDSREARLGLAFTLFQAGRPNDALQEIPESALGDSAFRLLRARILARVGRTDEARAEVDAAFPENSQRRLHERAHLVFERPSVPDATAELHRLVAAAPDDPLLRSLLGFYLAVHGSPDDAHEALDDLRQAAEAAPEDAEVQSNYGWGCFRLGRREEALKGLQVSLALDANRSTDRARLGFVLAALDRRQEAIEALQAAIAAEPNASWSTQAREVLTKLGATSKAVPPDAAGS